MPRRDLSSSAIALLVRDIPMDSPFSPEQIIIDFISARPATPTVANAIPASRIRGRVLRHHLPFAVITRPPALWHSGAALARAQLL